MKPLRLILADDHSLVRAGLRSLLEKTPGVQVVAEAGNGREAIELATKLQPDVVLMDIAMGDVSGLEAAARLRVATPRTKVVILSMHTGEAYVMQALAAGVAGYLLKDAAAVELELALRAVQSGETYLSPAIARQVVLASQRPAGAAPDALSPRQREVLRLLAEGKTTKEIAFALGVSAKTIETHRAELMRRLSIHDVAGLVRYAVRTGLVSSDT